MYEVVIFICAYYNYWCIWDSFPPLYSFVSYRLLHSVYYIAVIYTTFRIGADLKYKVKHSLAFSKQYKNLRMS